MDKTSGHAVGEGPRFTGAEGEESDSDEEEHKPMLPKLAQFAISECFIYFVFLGFYTMLLVLSRANGELNYLQTQGIEYNFASRGKGGSDPDADGFSRVDARFEDMNYLIRDDQINYLTPADITDMWTVVEMVIVPMLLPERHDNGDLIEESTSRLMVAGANRLLGGIRLRQVRVDPEKCLCDDTDENPDSEFLTTNGASEIFKECYPAYSSKKEATGPFTYGSQTMNWSDKKANVEQAVYFAKISSYGGGGYTVDLPLDHMAAASLLYELRSNQWIDRASRALFVDFNMYNANENLHTVGRITYEFPSVGGVYASREIKTWRFLRYLGNKGMVIKALEFIYIVFVLWFTFDEIREYIGHRSIGGCWWYCKVDKWNYVDMSNILLFYISIYMRYSIMTASNDMKFLGVYEFTSYRFLLSSYMQEAYVTMFNGFLLWMKIFKFFNCSPNVRFLFIMMSNAAMDLFYFCVALFFIILAFACICYTIFCSDVFYFRDFTHTFISLIQFMVSDMDLEKLQESNSMFAVPLYIAWTFLMILILANVFVAIVSEAYMTVKDEENEVNIKDMIKEGLLKNMLLKFVKFDSADADGDGKINEAELAHIASAAGHSAQDIISKYDADGDGQLDAAEYNLFQKNLVGNRQSMRS